MLRAFIVVCIVAASARAQSPSPSSADTPVRIQLSNSQLTDIIKLYQSLSHRVVWISADLHFDRQISIFTHHEVSRAEALSLIRGSLLQQGIDIREVGDSEAFVEYSTDPRVLSLIPASAGTPRAWRSLSRVSPSP
jgi:hypothetical protein